MRAFVWTCRGEWPKTSMWPLVGYNNPSNIFTVVDLPEPFGPSKPNTSPRRTSKSTASTARAFGLPQKSLKILVSPRTTTTGSFVFTLAGAEAVGDKFISAFWGVIQQSLGRRRRDGRSRWRRTGRADGVSPNLRATLLRRLAMIRIQFLSVSHQTGAVENDEQ